MEWSLTRTTCAADEVVIVLPDQVEDHKVGVKVPDARNISTQATRDKVEEAVIEVVMMTGIAEIIITAKDDSDTQPALPHLGVSSIATVLVAYEPVVNENLESSATWPLGDSMWLLD